METNKYSNIDLIEQFLDKKLSVDEELNFHNRLKQDKEFSELYNFRLKLREDLYKAREYEKVGINISNVIKKSKRNTRKRITMYALAASFTLFVAISGLINIVSKPGDSIQTVSGNKNDSLINETYTPQIKKAPIFANEGEYDSTRENISQTNEIQSTQEFILAERDLVFDFSIEKDSFIFSWEPALKRDAILLIMRAEDDKIMFETNLLKNSGRFALNSSNIPTGNYYWIISGLSKKKSFKIENE